MISTGQILAAATVTGIAVGLAAAVVRWSPAAVAAAALWSLALIAVWRWISNLLGLNGDFLPAISVGDTGCLIVGALGPAVVARLPWFSSGKRPPVVVVEGAAARFVSGRGPGGAGWRDLVPALVGAVVGFVINVVIL